MRNIPSEWKSQCKVSEAGEKAGEPPRSCGEWEGRGVGARMDSASAQTAGFLRRAVGATEAYGGHE